MKFGLEPIAYDTEQGKRQASFGTIEQMADNIYSELHVGGYALVVQDVQFAVIDSVRYYSGFAELDAVRVAQKGFELNLNVTLTADEWAILLPLVKAHCDLMQARLSDATKVMGVDGYELTVSSAQERVDTARANLQKEAYFEAPVMFVTI